MKNPELKEIDSLYHDYPSISGEYWAKVEYDLTIPVYHENRWMSASTFIVQALQDGYRPVKVRSAGRYKKFRLEKPGLDTGWTLTGHQFRYAWYLINSGMLTAA